MRKLNITPGTKKAQLLVWIAEQKGVRYGQIQRFICEELSGMDYDETVEEPVWKQFKSDCGNYTDWKKIGTKKVRVHRGIWATNLSSGKDPILKNYCFKAGGKWFVTPEVSLKLYIQAKNAAIKSDTVTTTLQGPPETSIGSTLERNFMSDEIPNNSKVVERKVIRMTVDGKDFKPNFNGVYPDIHMTELPKQMATPNPDQVRIDEVTNITAQIFAVNRALKEASEMIEKLTLRQNDLSSESYRLKKRLMEMVNGETK
jgi:hypothetical protein